jgi:hypothetical protein
MDNKVPFRLGLLTGESFFQCGKTILTITADLPWSAEVHLVVS